MQTRLEDLSDRELMLKYQNGNHHAFNILYARHSDKTYGYLSKRLHSKNDLDDLHQKVFIKFHKSRHLYKDKFDLLPWLYTITRTVYLDFLKKNKPKTTEYEEQLHSPIKNEVDALIDIDNEKTLTDKEKLVLKDRFYSDEDFKEIAKVLETSESNVRKIVSRAINKLRLKYKGVENE